MMCHPSVQRPLIWMLFLLPIRNGEPRSAGAGGAGLPHALSPGLPRVPPRDDEAVLEEGPGREAHLRVHPVLPGRLLHRHGAAVPARGQPLDQPLGGRGVQHRGPGCGFWGTWVNIQGWGWGRGGAKGGFWANRMKPWWGCTERGIDLKNYSTTTQVQKREEKKYKPAVFRRRGLSLVLDQGTKRWMEESHSSSAADKGADADSHWLATTLWSQREWISFIFSPFAFKLKAAIWMQRF